MIGLTAVDAVHHDRRYERRGVSTAGGRPSLDLDRGLVKEMADATRGTEAITTAGRGTKKGTGAKTGAKAGAKTGTEAVTVTKTGAGVTGGVEAEAGTEAEVVIAVRARQRKVGTRVFVKGSLRCPPLRLWCLMCQLQQNSAM